MNPETTPERGKGDLDDENNKAKEHVSERWQRTAVAAFYLAEARGFAPGRELDDWLAAERAFDAMSLASNAESAQRLPPEPGPPQPKEAKASARKRTGSKASARGRGVSRTLSTDVGGVA